MTLSASICAAPIKAEVIRVTRLDACGVPITGATGFQAVFDGFTEVQNSPQYEDGQRYLQKKANGQPCVNQKDPSFLNWIEQTVSLCTIDPRVITLVTGFQQNTESGTGTGAMADDGLLDRHFSIELWTPVAGTGVCSAAGQQYFYWAFPNMFDAKIQDFTFQNDVFTLSWQSISAPMYNVGVSDNWVTKMATVGSSVSTYLGTVLFPTVQGYHYGFNITTTTPPTAYCGAQSLPPS